LDEYNSSEIVTHAGEFFNFPILLGRKLRAEESVDKDADSDRHDHLNRVLGQAESIDTNELAYEAYGPTSLDDLIAQQDLEMRPTRFEDFDHGLNVEAVRPTDASGNASKEDIHTILQVWLHARADANEPISPCNVDATEQLIWDYVLGDIEHLLTLAERRPF